MNCIVSNYFLIEGKIRETPPVRNMFIWALAKWVGGMNPLVMHSKLCKTGGSKKYTYTGIKMLCTAMGCKEGKRVVRFPDPLV